MKKAIINNPKDPIHGSLVQINDTNMTTQLVQVTILKSTNPIWNRGEFELVDKSTLESIEDIERNKEATNTLKGRLIEFYFDWVNNWLSTVKMAEHYGLTKRECQELIEVGRKYHEENVERLKNRKP